MTNLIDTLKIDTPENVSFDYSVAGIGSRFLAAIVDTIIILLLQVIVLGTLLWVLLQSGDLSLTDPASGGGAELYYWVLGIFILLNFMFYWGYYIFFEILWNGQTPGKRLIDIRVIRVDGTPVAVTEIIIRNLVRTIDLLPMMYGVGVVTMFISQNSRRLGDLAAGTVVVHEKQAAQLHEITSGRQLRLSTVSPRNSLPPEFPIEGIKPEDINIIEEYLMRRHQLANRQQLAHHILKSILEHLNESSPSFNMNDNMNDADDALAAIYKAWKQRNSKLD
jgi:uncharacterized RDD family membrane protein YckC